MNDIRALYEQAGIEWVEQHTRWKHDPGKPNPAQVQAFVQKYVQIVKSGYGMVKSEGLADMSKSFRDTELNDLLDSWARLFLTPYGYRGKGSVTAIPARPRWL